MVKKWKAIDLCQTERETAVRLVRTQSRERRVKVLFDNENRMQLLIMQDSPPLAVKCDSIGHGKLGWAVLDHFGTTAYYTRSLLLDSDQIFLHLLVHNDKLIEL